MATLTETAQGFKLIVKVITACFVLLILYKIGTDVVHALFPKKPIEIPPEPPTTEFGKLPKLEIDSLSLSPGAKPTFSLDLVGAQLPQKPGQAKIYPILQAPYGFLALDRAKDLAEKFDFKDEPRKLNSIEYIWADFSRTLKMNVQNLNFTYTYNYEDDPSVFVAGNFFSKEAASNLAKTILEGKALLGGGGAFAGARGKDLVNGKEETKLLVWSEAKLRESQSLARTEAVRVDFFREPLDEIPILPPDPTESLVRILLSSLPDDAGAGKYQQVLELRYTLWVINREKSGTYPLKSSSQAWQEFQNTQKYLVYLKPEGEDITTSYTPLNVSRFVAKNVYLAYFDSEKPQNFLQPIWTFEGKAYLTSGARADWVAYIPAVAIEWVE